MRKALIFSNRVVLHGTKVPKRMRQLLVFISGVKKLTQVSASDTRETASTYQESCYCCRTIVLRPSALAATSRMLTPREDPEGAKATDCKPSKGPWDKHGRLRTSRYVSL